MLIMLRRAKMGSLRGFFSGKPDDENSRLEEISSGKVTATLGPEYVTIDITNRCNLGCSACWTYSPFIKKGRPGRSWFSQELSLSKIGQLVSDLKKLRTREIRITGGGEPFMHPQILEIIRLIKGKGFRLDITTNFTLLDKDKIAKIVSLGVDNITISLWAATEETYLKTHTSQKAGFFQKLRSNIIYLTEIKKKTTVVIANVLTNQNFTEAYDMASFAKECGADIVYFTLMDPVRETSHLLLSEPDRKALSKKFRQLESDYAAGKFGSLIIDNPAHIARRISSEKISAGEYDRDMIMKIPCTAGYTFSRILASGDVAPCCKAVNIISGNINRESFMDIWNNSRQRNFRRIGLTIGDRPAFAEKIGCFRTCDNIMYNIETYDKLRKLEGSIGKVRLKTQG